MHPRYGALLLAAVLVNVSSAPAQQRVLDSWLHHLRIGSEPEWSEFPREVEGPRLLVRFQAARDAGESALRLRQQDVKQAWKVLLNAKELGRLQTDENDMVIYLPIPAGRLLAGETTLIIEQERRTPQDVR